MSTKLYAEREKVKNYIAPKRTEIKPGICLGCMREKPLGFEHRAFCDRFCEELWRKDMMRRERNSLPSEPKRSSFFVASATEEVLCSALTLTVKETAQYEPKW